MVQRNAWTIFLIAISYGLSVGPSPGDRGLHWGIYYNRHVFIFILVPSLVFQRVHQRTQTKILIAATAATAEAATAATATAASAKTAAATAATAA
jgi:hypothetical protein